MYYKREGGPCASQNPKETLRAEQSRDKQCPSNSHIHESLTGLVEHQIVIQKVRAEHFQKLPVRLIILGLVSGAHLEWQGATFSHGQETKGLF